MAASDLVIMASIDPHGLGLACASEAALLVKPNGLSIGNEYVLMKVPILRQ
jgi:hypothetical protein